jgi:hypothetical protein
MIEVIVTAAMLFGSVFLFAYWFRYTCLLILSTKTARDYAGALAEAYQLSFVDVQSRLRNCATANLERLHQSLDHDFAVVRRLACWKMRVRLKAKRLSRCACCR